MMSHSHASRILRSGLLLLVVLGVVIAVVRVLTVAGLAAPVTQARLEVARWLVPTLKFAEESEQIEQHFADSAMVTLFHVIAGGVFLALGSLQFSASIRTRHPRFHRRSGRFLVGLAMIAGTTGLWMGVVDPYSSTERLPTAALGALFLIAPIKAITAIRRADVVRHREWMIRFFAIGVSATVIRLISAPILWLLSPASFREVVGLIFWAGLIISLVAAEALIRSTRVIPIGSQAALAR